MVKAINSVVKRPVVRNLVLAGMLTASALGMNSCVNKNSSKDAVQNQTEVVSKAGAEALKNNVLINSSPKECNEKVYNLFDEIDWDIDNDFYKVNKNPSILKSNYQMMVDKYGIYTATMHAIKMMAEYNLKEALYEIAMDYKYSNFGRINEEALEKAEKNLKRADKLFANIDKKFLPAFNQEFEMKDYSAEELSQKLDDFVMEQKYIMRHHKNKYKENVEKYELNQPEEFKNTPQGLSDLIAVKTYYLFQNVFGSFIKKADVFTDFTFTDFTYYLSHESGTSLSIRDAYEIK